MQQLDGSWGYFHSLGQPRKPKAITMEQALRRLLNLGFTADDEPIKRAVIYIENCLKDEIQIPDRREKFCDWDVFKALMFATWLKIFLPENHLALEIAGKWAEVIENAFFNGSYNHAEYLTSFFKVFGIKPDNNRNKDFVTFYHVSILQGMLKPGTERKVIKHILENQKGIYYIYEAKIADLPQNFASLQTSRYLSSIELLSGFDYAKEYLEFVVQWLKQNQGEDGFWDLGPSARDGIYFPLSDSWRSVRSRKNDCTARIEKLSGKL